MKIQKIKVKNNYVLRERRAKIIELESIMSIKMLNIVRQFDMAYGNLKERWGETGGIPEEEAMILRDDALNAIREFSDFMRDFSEKVDFKYYPPKGLGGKKPSFMKLIEENAVLDSKPIK
jgi:hypothetical protein